MTRAQLGGRKLDVRIAMDGVRGLIAAVLAISAFGLLTGCSSFFSGSSNSTHLAYIAGGFNNVAAYRVDNNTGVATALVGSPFLAGNSPSGAVMNPAGTLLYVSNQADGTISLFKINSTSGALTEVLPRTSTPGMVSPGPMTMDSGGALLFVADQVANSVWAFQIGASGGLTLASPSVSVGASPQGLVLTAAGYLYVPVPTFSSIAVLNVNSGSLQSVGSFPVALGVAGVTVDSAAKFLYAANPATNTVSGFSIQSGGSLTPVLGLTVGAGTTPVALAVDPSGKYLYVANSGSSNISEYTIDATTGVPTLSTTAPTVGAGTNPAFFVIDPDGKFVFVGNNGSKSITEFLINTNGTLANENTILPTFVPRSLALAP